MNEHGTYTVGPEPVINRPAPRKGVGQSQGPAFTARLS